MNRSQSRRLLRIEQEEDAETFGLDCAIPALFAPDDFTLQATVP